MNMVHTFANLCVMARAYLEECIQSLLNQKTESKILIATSTPNSQILEMGEKYDIPIFVNYLEKVWQETGISHITAPIHLW